MYFVLLGRVFERDSHFLGLYRDRERAVAAAIKEADKEVGGELYWDGGVSVIQCDEGGNLYLALGQAVRLYGESGAKWQEY